MCIIEVSQALQYGMGYLSNNLDIDWPDALVDAVKRTLVHEFHAYTDVRVGQEGAIEGNDIIGMTVVHNLQLSEDLLPDGGFRVYQHDLLKMSQLTFA